MRILITGAARAIGATTARVLTERGHEVVATARELASLGTVEAVQRLVLDVRNTDSVAAAVAQAGPLDTIVNNAAVHGGRPARGLSHRANPSHPRDQHRRCPSHDRAVVPAWRNAAVG